MGGMTASSFRDRGVRFERQRGRLTVRGPRDPDLHAQLLTEVERRLALVDPLPPPQPAGRCGCCWDPLPQGRGGMCELCVLARQKVTVSQTPQGGLFE